MYSPSKNVIISVLTRIHQTRYWSCMERGLLGELDCKFDKDQISQVYLKIRVK